MGREAGGTCPWLPALGLRGGSEGSCTGEGSRAEMSTQQALSMSSIQLV